MMLLLEHQVINGVKKQKGRTLIRRLRCLSCNGTLAIEITNKLGARGEYYVVKDAIRVGEDVDFLYAKEVWFGNKVRCPRCGVLGRLPMDKPLAAEEIAKREEAFNAKATTIR